jgi:hypothetical protein
MEEVLEVYRRFQRESSEYVRHVTLVLELRPPIQVQYLAVSGLPNILYGKLAA